MSLNSSINVLIEEISATKEFQNLRSLKAAIGQDQKLTSLVEQFQRKQANAYAENLPPQKMQALMEELEKEYAQLSTIPIVKQYFDAGDSLNQLIGNIIKNINTGLEKRLS